MQNKIVRGYNRIKFPSTKLGKTVFCRSLLLRDYLLHLEWDQNIKSYQTNPFKVSYRIDTRRKTFQPHLLLIDIFNSQTLVWLKSSVEDEDKHSRFIRLMSNICELNDYSFAVKTSDEIRKNPFFSNLKLLRRYNRLEISIDQILLCNDFFKRFLTPLLGDLIEFLLAKNVGSEIAYALLSQKIIETEMHLESISVDSSIKLKNQFPNFQSGRIAL